MYRIGGGTFTTLEKAQITYDMMYYGSRGIHRANINAKTVMGGLVTYDDRYPVDFLNDLYDCIYNGDAWDSKDPKDYFQIACWHPYFGNFTKADWKARNDLLYNVIKTREGKDKKVFCTEAGFNDYYGGNASYQDNVASYITQMYEAAREQGYIETIHYYKMYDNENSSYNRYGLFTDPAYVRDLSSYLDANLKVAPSLASPKPGAYAYQTAAGGTGDLFSYSKYIRY